MLIFYNGNGNNSSRTTLSTKGQLTLSRDTPHSFSLQLHSEVSLLWTKLQSQWVQGQSSGQGAYVHTHPIPQAQPASHFSSSWRKVEGWGGRLSWWAAAPGTRKHLFQGSLQREIGVLKIISPQCWGLWHLITKCKFKFTCHSKAPVTMPAWPSTLLNVDQIVPHCPRPLFSLQLVFGLWKGKEAALGPLKGE